MLLRRLAVGGMAEVYVAKTKGIGGFEKLVAIKVIHPRFSEDEHFIQMLVEEAKISVQLSHVNIAQTFDLGCIDDTYYIAMEYVEGADTYRVGKRALDKVDRLPIDICCYIGAEVCHGLGYAHRKRDADGNPLGIVHRDISPQNVLISYAGEVKLVDFGIAKAALRTGQTEVGVIKGKYYYMSPEQAWGDPVDQRSDVFSTGLLLHELLTGEMVYQENNVPALLDLVRKAEIKGPKAKRPEIPEELDRVLLRACAKEPEDRYQSAHALAQDLTEILYRRNPTFTAAKVGALMGQLFPDAVKRNSQITKLPTEPPTDEPTREPPPPSTSVEQLLESMSRDEFTPAVESSVIFDLDELDDMTRNDILPFVRKTSSAEHTEPGEETDARQTRQLRASSDDGPTSTARTVGRADEWEEDTFLKDRNMWDESTLVDDDGQAMVDAHRMIGAARRGPPTGDLKGEATVASASPFMSPPPRKQPSRPPPARLPSKPFAAPPRPPPPPRRAVAKAPSRPPPARIGSSAPGGAPLWAGAAAPAMQPEPVDALPDPPPVPTDASALPGELPGEKTTALADMEQLKHRPYSDAGPSMGGIRLGPQAERYFQGGQPSQPPQPGPPPGTGQSGGFAPPPPHDPFAPPPQVTGPNAAQLGKPQPLKWLLLGGAAAFGVLLLLGVLILVLSGSEPSTVEILSVPEGARVTVDGRPVDGVTPVHLEEVEPGATMHVEIRLDGYEPRSENIVIGEGDNRRLIVLNPAQITLHIESVPSGAQIWIDDVHRGNSPLDISLTVGQAVNVRARVAGRPEVAQRVVANPGQPRQTLSLTFPP